MHRRAFDLGQNRFDRRLNGRQSGLHLPAMEIGPVVAESDANPPHFEGLTRRDGNRVSQPRFAACKAGTPQASRRLRRASPTPPAEFLNPRDRRCGR